MAVGCYFVRLSFGLKDCRAARANGAYADSTTKTNGFNQFFKLCFCAGERRGEQNTHGSDKKTHATKALKICVFCHFWCLFRSRHPSRKKVPKMTSQSPSGTLPGTRQEGKIGLLVALGAFQGRFWTPKGAKRPPPEARIRGPPRPTSTRKSYTKILVKRSFQTALRKIHQRSLAQWPVLGAQPHWRSGH